VKKREFDQIEKRDVEDKGLIESAAFSALMVGASVEAGWLAELLCLTAEAAVLLVGHNIMSTEFRLVNLHDRDLILVPVFHTLIGIFVGHSKELIGSASVTEWSLSNVSDPKLWVVELGLTSF